jgi:hypothetical protein
VSALPPQRDALHPATSRLHHRRHLDLRHHQGPRQRSPHATPAHWIVLSLSSDEKNFIIDTSREGEFTKKLFGDLNRDIIRPPGDGKVIILDDSDEEKEASNEKMAVTELAATSAVVNPALTAFTVTDDAPVGANNDNSDD